MCCSECKNDFDEDSVKLIREEKNIKVFEIICGECGKNFGTAIMYTEFDDEKDDAFDFIPCPLPVGYDEVLDAHIFIDKLKKDWTKYIPEDFKHL